MQVKNLILIEKDLPLWKYMSKDNLFNWTLNGNL